MKLEIDLPLLQSVKLGNEAFQNTKSFAMSKLTSLVSIDIGQYCFYYASSFSLIGRTELNEMKNRSSSTSISQTGWWCIR